VQLEDDQVAGVQTHVAAAAEVLEQALLDEVPQLGQDTGHGGSLLRACRPRSFCTGEPPFSFPSSPSSTPSRCRKIAHGHLGERGSSPAPPGLLARRPGGMPAWRPPRQPSRSVDNASVSRSPRRSAFPVVLVCLSPKRPAHPQARAYPATAL